MGEWAESEALLQQPEIAEALDERLRHVAQVQAVA